MNKPTLKELINKLQSTRQGQDKLSEFVSHNIGICQSFLVDALLTKGYDMGALEGFSHDDIENLYPGWEETQETRPLECTQCGEEVPVNDNEVCEDCFESEPQEIFEWWAIDSYMAEKLREQGEPILDNDYGTWWGRTTTGQAIMMDYVIAKIYAIRELEYWNESDQKEYDSM